MRSGRRRWRFGVVGVVGVLGEGSGGDRSSEFGRIFRESTAEPTAGLVGELVRMGGGGTKCGRKPGLVTGGGRVGDVGGKCEEEEAFLAFLILRFW